MKASEIIKQLAELIADHGDTEVLPQIVSVVGDSYDMSLQNLWRDVYRNEFVMEFCPEEDMSSFCGGDDE